MVTNNLLQLKVKAGADPGKLQGEGHESKWCPLPIPKIKNSSDFGHLILVVPYFQFFIIIFYFLFFFLVSVLATTKFANCKQVYMNVLCIYVVDTRVLTRDVIR